MRFIDIRGILLALAAATLWLNPLGGAAAGTLDKLRDSGKFVIGYATDGSALVHRDASGKLGGYAIEICGRVGAAVKAGLKLPKLSVEFVQLSMDERFLAVAEGRVDLLCGAEPTVGRRAALSFSLPIGFVGVTALVRSDAPVRLVQVLSGQEPPAPLIWRGTGAPERRSLAVVKGTTVEGTLTGRLLDRRIVVDVVPVKDTAEGVQAVLDRRADAFFDGRPMLLGALEGNPARSNLVVLDRLFSRHVLALGLRRNDDDFRLAVDTALSALYHSPELAAIYRSNLGEPDQATLEFLQLVALPN